MFWQSLLSSSVKCSKCGLSISKSPTTSPFLSIGVTNSLLLAESHAIWPGKSCTFLTLYCFLSLKEAPQTPLPILILVQAGYP